MDERSRSLAINLIVGVLFVFPLLASLQVKAVLAVIQRRGARTELTASVRTVCSCGCCDYVSIQDAVDAAREGDIVKVASGTYTDLHARPRADIEESGTVTQVVYISKTIVIRGGYTVLDGLADPPDSDRNPTILDAQDHGRVVYITGDISPTIEGVWITGGEAGGLGGNPYLDKDAGGGMYVITATAMISGNRIYGNEAQRGGGLHLHTSKAIVSNNAIYSNNTDKQSDNNGGGLYLWGSDATLVGNAIFSNGGHSGGGLYLRSGNATLIGNTINANSAEWRGGGLAIGQDSTAALWSNTISGNQAEYQGGGLHLQSGNPEMEGNIISSNTAEQGAGLSAWASAPILRGNHVSSNVAEYGGGLYLIHSSPTLSNNLIANNRVDVSGGGLYVAGSSPRLLHNTIARNSGGDGIGVYSYTMESTVTLYSNVTLTNTLLVSHTVGITVARGNTVTIEGVLWYNIPVTVSKSPTAVVTVRHQYLGNPAFAPDGYHLLAGSAAIDQGVSTEISVDIDGDPRPIGLFPDLGADEAWRCVYLPVVLK